MTPPYTWSDSWLLLSIGASGHSGATLTDIVAAGDMLNHAIFTGTEIRRGLAKLAAAGYVVQKADRFYVVGSARLLLQDFNGSSERSDWRECDKLLGIEPGSYTADANVEDPNWNYAFATDEAVKEAYRQYQGEAQQETDIAISYATKRRR
jgi:hypothetical protein